MILNEFTRNFDAGDCKVIFDGQQITLESWLPNLEQTALTCCQPLPRSITGQKTETHCVSFSCNPSICVNYPRSPIATLSSPSQIGRAHV